MNPTSPTQPIAWDKFTQVDAHGAMFSPSLQIVLYANKPLPELAAGAIACYELIVREFGGALTLYHARSMRKPRRFGDKYADVFPTLCREPEIGLPEYRVFNGKDRLFIFADYEGKRVRQAQTFLSSVPVPAFSM